MTLLDHGIWWHVYPLGATGAPVRPADGQVAGAWPVEHRLRRLEPWLDYVVELGCSGLLLGPVFASVSHGYDTLDHFRIDPRLGDEADFDHLVEQARARGLSVLLDGVFNHLARGHPRLTGAGTDQASLAKRGRQGELVGWEGHRELVELDHEQEAVRALVAEVMLHWLRRGVAGWRLDVAYAVPPEFWRDVLGRVRREFPDALFLGEVIHGDYAAIAQAGTLDSVTQYALWKAIWSSIVDRNFWELAWALERHQEFSSQLVTQTFVGNHDVDRIASTVGDHGAVLAAVVLFTVPGMPSVYYGDEQGFRGRRGEGFAADDPVRPPLPDDPAGLAPLGAWLHEIYRALISLRRRHPWLVRSSVEVLDKTNTELRYRCAGAGHTLTVSLGTVPGPWVTVTVGGEESFAWRSPD